MTTSQNEVEVDESSGVTALRPMPAKPARLFELAEGDSTAYFSASELLERGKALSAHAEEPEADPRPPRASWLTQFGRASWTRKVSAIALPVLCVLLLARPLLQKSQKPVLSKPSSGAPVPELLVQAKPAVPPPSASSTTLLLPRGVTAAHAAADGVATGDFSRAATLYRELSLREPQNQAYREAARILSKRTQTPSP